MHRFSLSSCCLTKGRPQDPRASHRRDCRLASQVDALLGGLDRPVTSEVELPHLSWQDADGDVDIRRWV